MSDFTPTKEQLQILEQLKEVTEPYYVYTEQMMAIAMWIDAVFEQKSKANGENEQQDKALHLRGVVPSTFIYDVNGTIRAFVENNYTSACVKLERLYPNEEWHFIAEAKTIA